MRAFFAVVFSIFSMAAFASAPTEQCEFVDAPTLPNGAEATPDAMQAAGSAVRDYVKAMQAALACMDEAEASIAETLTPEQRKAITAKYNDGVDRMNAIATQYNEQVRAFNARSE